jgi:dimethylhistidine N-methyltransferase
MAAPALWRTQHRLTECQAQFAADIRAGLLREGQKELPSKYLYDQLGSALFEAICLLPEYGLNRAGARLMRRYAHEIARLVPSPVVVAELGSGNGTNTRWLLEALAARQTVDYFPIDISSHALARCRQELGQLDRVNLSEIESSYLEGLSHVAGGRSESERLLVLFLGSTIGNFDRLPGQRFLDEVRQALLPGDALLLATDLEKPVPQLIVAYDDPTGVTAAFNLNLLARINRELDGGFDLGKFQHEARWNAHERRIEMHLRSTVAQRVSIARAGFEVALRQGETIWTESSHKYTTAEAIEIGERAGFDCAVQWIDSEWPFAQSLLIAR